MKKGQAQIFVVVIIILLVLSAFIILYNVVNITVENSSDEITIDPFSTKLKIVQADLDESATFLMVRTDDGSQNYDSFKFIFYDVNGNTHIVDRSEGIPENDLDVGIFGFTHFEIDSAINIGRISVFPLFQDIPGFEFEDDDFDDNRKFGTPEELHSRYCDLMAQCTSDLASSDPMSRLEQFKCDFYTEKCSGGLGSGTGGGTGGGSGSCGDGFCDPITENSENCFIDCS